MTLAVERKTAKFQYEFLETPKCRKNINCTQSWIRARPTITMIKFQPARRRLMTIKKAVAVSAVDNMNPNKYDLNVPIPGSRNLI